MIRAAFLIVAAALAMQSARPPTFKVLTDLVRVDVLAERDGRPIAGLTAEDFLVRDNGVPQRITLVTQVDSVTVSVLLDVSGSMTAEKLKNADAGVRAVLATMRERDRFALYAVATDVRRISVPSNARTFSSNAVVKALRESSGGFTSLFDGLLAAVVQGAVEDGPKLLVALTDGRNNTSWVNARSVVDAARRGETIVYPVSVGDTPVPFDRHLRPMTPDNRRLLEILAERTGGRVVHADWSRDLAPVFESIIREYRQRYIVTFVPDGVKRGDGWHKLEVGLRSRDGKVHARTGYLSR